MIAYKERWLQGTVRWMCVVYWRRQRSGPLVVANSAWLEDFEGAGAGLERREEQLALTLACTQLPYRERQVVHLRYRLGMTLAEAGRVLGCWKTSVLRDERRAIARLKAFTGRPCR
jgi:RNA polymerase sigma factor (sigma-70 family)